MHPIARKFGPTAAVFAITAWCGWQYLEDASPLEDLSAGARTKINGDALSPELPPKHPRNLFAVGGAVATKQKLAEAAAAAPPPYDPAKMLAELKLNGTFIHGDRRFAVINERVFDEGQTIATDADAAKDCQLVSVESNSALLDVDGKRFRLSYGPPEQNISPVRKSGWLPSPMPSSGPGKKSVGVSLFRAVTRSVAKTSPNPALPATTNRDPFGSSPAPILLQRSESQEDEDDGAETRPRRRS